MAEVPVEYKSIDDLWESKLQTDGNTKDTWYAKSLAYWDQQEASISGVLGGFEHTSNPDLMESGRILAELKKHNETVKKEFSFGSVLDCGAGVGRITEGLLLKHFSTVDLLEPCKKQMEGAKSRLQGKVRHFFTRSLQNFDFETEEPDDAAETFSRGYDAVWNQWVLLYLTDDDLIAYFQRCKKNLNPGGFIFCKENVLLKRGGSNNEDFDKGFAIDQEDNGLTRSDARYRELFAEAGLELVMAVRQKSWPKDLYPIMMYVVR